MRVVDVVDVGVNGVGEGGDEGKQPEQGDDLGGAPQSRHGVRVQRVADGEVPEKFPRKKKQ